MDAKELQKKLDEASKATMGCGCLLMLLALIPILLMMLAL